MKKSEIREMVREEIIKLSEKTKSNKKLKMKLLRKGIKVRYDKSKAEADLKTKNWPDGKIIVKKFGMRRGYYAVPKDSKTLKRL